MDGIVLDFPIFPAVENGWSQSVNVNFGSGNPRKMGGFARQFLRGTYEHTGDTIFHNTGIRPRQPRSQRCADTPFTRYNQLSNRLNNRFDNRLYPVSGL